MSPEDVETLRGVRYRVSLPPERAAGRRTLDERLYVRFPVLYRLLAKAMMRLPTRSRLRGKLIVRVSARAVAAGNRRDFDVLLLGFDPRIELRPLGDWAEALDIPPVFYGHEGYRDVWRTMTEGFGDMWLDPEEVVDLGDYLLAMLTVRGHGSRSGVPLTLPLFQLFRFRDGLVVWQRDFADRDSALEAVRRSEQDAHAYS
ncbi:MAG TPA: nuclear transport factor 2 family protein [Thermoleophilaceae bacterium]